MCTIRVGKMSYGLNKTLQMYTVKTESGLGYKSSQVRVQVHRQWTYIRTRVQILTRVLQVCSYTVLCAKLQCTGVSNSTLFASQVRLGSCYWEIARRSFTSIFSVLSSGKSTRFSWKMISHILQRSQRPLQPRTVWGDRLSAPAADAKIRCLSFIVFH